MTLRLVVCPDDCVDDDDDDGGGGGGGGGSTIKGRKLSRIG